MQIDSIKSKLKESEYSFLYTNKHLQDNVIMLCLAGSYAYGTATANSDIDIRGCALNTKKEILLSTDFEQVTDKETDTVIYSFNKLIRLLTACNPNVLELLGLPGECYLYISPVGRYLIQNSQAFLSKRVITTFGGYINSQLQKFNNVQGNKVNAPKLCKHMMHLMRLYFTGTDILKDKLIITRRLQENSILMDIRNGKYLTAENYPTKEYWDLMSNCRKRFIYASQHTSLPEEPDMQRIDHIQMYINENIVKGVYKSENID